MTTLMYRPPVDSTPSQSDATRNNTDYPTGFDIRNSASVRKIGIGLGTAALLVALAAPAGQKAALDVGHETRKTISNISASAKYGDAGIITYTPMPVKLPYETTPRAIAEDIAGDGNIAREIGLADLLARYITKANGLPSENAAIKAGQNIRTLVYDDANGRNLGSLVDDVEKVK